MKARTIKDIIVDRNELTVRHGRELSGIDWLPDNIARYFAEHHATIDISVCHTDVECGYGDRITKSFRVLLPFCKCQRCGYHSLWNPDDSGSKCLRHTYTQGWDVVFSYTLDTGEKKLSLQNAFDEFLSLQSDGSARLPVVQINY